MNILNMNEYENKVIDAIDKLNDMFNFLIGKYIAYRSTFENNKLVYFGRVEKVKISKIPIKNSNLRFLITYIDDNGERHDKIFMLFDILYTDNLDEVEQWRLEMELQK